MVFANPIADSGTCQMDMCKIYSLNANDACMAICGGKVTKGGKQFWAAVKERLVNMSISYMDGQLGGQRNCGISRLSLLTVKMLPGFDTYEAKDGSVLVVSIIFVAV
ncbi:hypothetical protein BST61_g3687 [Cercospora zeina]